MKVPEEQRVPPGPGADRLEAALALLWTQQPQIHAQILVRSSPGAGQQGTRNEPPSTKLLRPERPLVTAFRDILGPREAKEQQAPRQVLLSWLSQGMLMGCGRSCHAHCGNSWQLRPKCVFVREWRSSP